MTHDTDITPAQAHDIRLVCEDLRDRYGVATPEDVACELIARGYDTDTAYSLVVEPDDRIPF